MKLILLLVMYLDGVAFVNSQGTAGVERGSFGDLRPEADLQ